MAASALVLAAGPADAAAGDPAAEDEPAAPGPAASDAPELRVGGYLEAYYSYNFARPQSGVTAHRGFDNRHDSITLANAVLSADASASRFSARLALQVGHTPNTYYLAEPDDPGADGAGATGAPTWRLLQEAYLGYELPVGRGLKLEAGLFLSPIGPESIAVKDNFNWSRSTLFFALPFYHTGLRASLPLSNAVTVTALVSNGWNSVVDGNRHKSFSLQMLAQPMTGLTWSLLYFGGPERPTGAPEGEPWRHLFDTWAQWDVHPSLSVLGQLDAGLEDGRYGAHTWAAAALSARVKLFPWLFVAARRDGIFEQPGERGGRASPIFFSTTRVDSTTATLDVRPHEQLSLRLEARRDRAADRLYFEEGTPGEADSTPSAFTQQTVTLGLSGWF